MKPAQLVKIIGCNGKRAVFLYPLFLQVATVDAQLKSAQQIIGPYKTVFSKPPSRTPGTVAVDGPLLGNGFAAVTMAGPPERQEYYLARNDFWRLKSGFNESFPAVLGKLQINIPALQQSSYRIEQDLFNSITVAYFNKGDASVSIRSIMAATKDWLIIEVVNNGRSVVKGNVALGLPGDDQFHINLPLENKFPDTLAHGETSNGVCGYNVVLLRMLIFSL